MNKINIQQTGGFPLETDTLKALQDAYSMMQAFGEILAPLAIISGCQATGNNVSNGIVYINGEVLEFRGGAASRYVVIREETESRNFENGEQKTVFIRRWATFGESVQQQYEWSEFYRNPSMQALSTMIANRVIWADFNALKNRVDQLEVFARPFSNGNGAVLFLRPANEIPEGWEEVTDLRGRMPLGWDPNDSQFNLVGRVSGVSKTYVEKRHLPPVGIPYKDAYMLESASSNPGVNGKITLGQSYYGNNKADHDNNTLYYRNATTDPIGDGQALDVLNPNRIVIFIKPI
ncbi:hypothetical protein QP547_04725 [Weeksella virosa]|uniref:hypothetical protein n=1 Tax=Weeksella virosa TaxID=1014 RepID=UPI002552C09D|nr:hypothetical protein [Weeksella virosa]MDK7675114.1 hypothetical protein [Weeksella virosa]